MLKIFVMVLMTVMSTFLRSMRTNHINMILIKFLRSMRTNGGRMDSSPRWGQMKTAMIRSMYP